MFTDSPNTDSPNTHKVLSFEWPAEFVDYLSGLQVEANRLGVEFDAHEIFGKAIQVAAERFEIRDLHKVAKGNYTLSKEAKKRIKSQANQGKKGAQTRRDKLPSITEAQKNPNSIHFHVTCTWDVDTWNVGIEKTSKRLAGADVAHVKRKIKNGYRDLIIKDGWDEDSKADAERAFATLPSREESAVHKDNMNNVLNTAAQQPLDV